MRGIVGRYKRYVDVTCVTDAAGASTPATIWFDEQTPFEVEEVLDVRPARSRKVDGAGLRHTVRVRGQLTYLFREGDAWFVEGKVAEL